ncbi:MAG: Gfo/Idh/MocA family oxidoreductase [Flavobacteriaceae bacterium]|nr:Gfo/Idh/MocA family oxidoreductase [Flavobacteriaceae bacterium]
MKKRDFLKTSAALASTTLMPSSLLASFSGSKTRLRTAHIGVGAMGAQDLQSIASHKSVDVVALCDVDSKSLEAAHIIYPDAKIFKDYRVMLKDMSSDFDAVIVSTPDHTHAPASIMAMEMNKPIYCQKPLTHFVSEAREMKKLAEQKNLVTQM